MARSCSKARVHCAVSLDAVRTVPVFFFFFFFLLVLVGGGLVCGWGGSNAKRVANALIPLDALLSPKW